MSSTTTAAAAAAAPLLSEASGGEATATATGGGGGSAVVSFYTHTYAEHMPEQVYSVPLTVLPDGLNQLVQSVLGVSASQRFDFLYKDEYIATSLLRFLQRRGISYEELLHIEYTPALQSIEGALLPHDDWVSSVRAPYLGNSEVVLTGAYDHGVRLWSGDSCLAVGSLHTGCVKAVCVHPVVPASSTTADVDGGSAVAAAQTRRRATTAATTAASARKRGRHADLVDFDCVSCSKDGSIAAWRYDSATSTLQLRGSVCAHRDSVDDVDIAPRTGSLVATASWDATVRLYTWAQLHSGGRDTLPSSKAPLLVFTDHTRPVCAVRFSHARGEAVVYSAGLDGAIKSLDVAAATLQTQWRCSHPIAALAVRPTAATADLLLAACTDNRARLYDTRTQAVVHTFSGHRQWLYAATWLWDAREGEATLHSSAQQQQQQHGGGSSSSSSMFFATASEDATVRVYDLRCTHTALLTMDTLHTDGVLDVSYAGQSAVVSCGKDNKTRSFTLTKEALV